MMFAPMGQRASIPIEILEYPYRPIPIGLVLEYSQPITQDKGEIHKGIGPGVDEVPIGEHPHRNSYRWENRIIWSHKMGT